MLCAKCGQHPNATIHTSVGGHVFEPPKGVPYRPERPWGLWLFLGTTVVAFVAAALLW